MQACFSFKTQNNIKSSTPSQLMFMYHKVTCDISMVLTFVIHSWYLF